MAAKKVHRVRIDLPPEYNKKEREAIAEDVLEFIRDRTQRGINKKGGRFPGYSKSYKNSLEFKVSKRKGGPVNLTLSGDMLAEMDLRKQGKGFIEIGFDAGKINDRAEGNILGTYGNKTPLPGKKRDFLGITKKDLNIILKDFKAEETIARKKAAEKASKKVKVEK